MRFCWVDAGNDPAYSILEPHKIDGCFFDVREKRLSKAYVQDVKARGYAVGVYMVDSWPETKNLTGAQAAEWMDARITATGIWLALSLPKVQFDLERHDPAWIQECLTRWRELRPKQDTSWTMEPMQGGWMHEEFVMAILRAKVRIVPQYYGGNMQPFAQDRCYRDLLVLGFHESLITGFYDAAALPAYWDGFAFAMGRLPR